MQNVARLSLHVKQRQEFRPPLGPAVRKRISFLEHKIDSLWFDNNETLFRFFR